LDSGSLGRAAADAMGQARQPRGGGKNPNPVWSFTQGGGNPPKIVYIPDGAADFHEFFTFAIFFIRNINAIAYLPKTCARSRNPRLAMGQT
jgi:hypothetical protein